MLPAAAHPLGPLLRPRHLTRGTGELERDHGAGLGMSDLAIAGQGGSDASPKSGKVHFYRIVLYTTARRQHLD